MAEARLGPEEQRARDAVRDARAKKPMDRSAQEIPGQAPHEFLRSDHPVTLIRPPHYFITWRELQIRRALILHPNCVVEMKHREGSLFACMSRAPVKLPLQVHCFCDVLILPFC